MAKLRIFVSGTFVLILLSGACFASPQDQVPNAPNENEKRPDKPLDDDLSIGKPQELDNAPAIPDARYYPYQQALTVRAGLAVDAKDTSTMDQVIGFQFLFPKFLAPKLEAGADLHIASSGDNSGHGHIYAGARWIAHQRSYFRPSMKLSLDHFIDSKENLASITHFDNYFARGTATYEYAFWNPCSARLEVEALVNLKQVIGEITLGINRAW